MPSAIDEAETSLRKKRRKHKDGGEEKKSSKKKKRRHERSHGEHTERSPELGDDKPETPTRSPNAINSSQVDTTDDSPFHLQTTSFYVPLSPVAQASPLDGLCAEHLSPLLLTYCVPLKGVVLSYSKPRLSNRPQVKDESLHTQVRGRMVDEYAVTYTWITAEFLVFRPQKNTWIEGYINVQSKSHIGLVCWNLFNARIEARNLPRDWRWVDKAAKARSGTASAPQSGNRRQGEVDGHFVKPDGEMLEELIKFRVLDFENLPAYGKDKVFVSIEGSLVDDKEEQSRPRNSINGPEKAKKSAMRKAVIDGTPS